MFVLKFNSEAKTVNPLKGLGVVLVVFTSYMYTLTLRKR